MSEVQPFIDLARAELCASGRPIKSRVMTAIALLEKLREDPVFDLEHHIAGVRSGFKSQNRYAQQAIERLGLKGEFGEYGRRSNDLTVWGPKYMTAFHELRISSDTSHWTNILESIHEFHASLWRELYSYEPLRPNFSLGTSTAVIADLLTQARTHGTLPVSAYAIVAAKLEIRLDIEIPVARLNQPDRSPSNRSKDKPADFVVGDVSVEVTMAGPDDKHLRQMRKIVREWKKEAWMIVHPDDLLAWQEAIRSHLGQDSHMAIAFAVDAFVGQNMAELGRFTRPETQSELHKLFVRYNTRWASAIDAPHIVVES